MMSTLFYEVHMLYNDTLNKRITFVHLIFNDCYGKMLAEKQIDDLLSDVVVVFHYIPKLAGNVELNHSSGYYLKLAVDPPAMESNHYIPKRISATCCRYTKSPVW